MNKIRPFRRHPSDLSSSLPATSAASSDPARVTLLQQQHPLLLLWRHQILDPDSDIVTHWNHLFMVTCILALFIDPLYFYLPYVGGPACLSTDTGLGVLITIFRTIADLFHLLHIVMKFRTAFVAPSSRVFGRGELVMDAREIATRYLKTDFVIDFAAMLPLPQVLGAMWYLLSIGRQFACWTKECRRENGLRVLDCLPSFLDCNSLENPERQYWQNVTRVLSNCEPKNSNNNFKFGMFADAFINDVASADFVSKYLYCLWWGLRNLSSYGQTLETSIYIGETLFCLGICILGLILFSLLIGNMQTSLQSMSVRVEEWRVKRRDTEEWMRHRQLPPELQERVRQFVQYKWLATRGVDEEFILHSLPLDLRREIQRHLCLSLVRRVPFFSQMDDQLLDAICERLVSSLSTPGTFIVREDDLVNEMLFIIRGQLESSTTNGGRSGFFNSIVLRPGDFCGEELLTWALMPTSSLNLPSSTRTVRAFTEVEAFALSAEDLKFVAHQFKRLQSKKLQHAFRYYSHQWRTWGACFIQAAWRRHKKRQMAKELLMLETDYIDREEGEDYESSERSSVDNAYNAQHLGVTFLASKFAANTRRGANQKGTVTASVIDTSSSSLKMPKLFKPADFYEDQSEV
ncbi:cyclic nucleotide-gated ion channel 18 isoform X2 [Carica papaya]|uniref:cyclic nucleotide-gated ion channel 18 isoform X2 n=1 Tax=Carica papaya TaxID=3649 RepID=UPI000B8C9800|nr:cyclic nucleotide-gated ion channel 18 isoform X2 [Carica papaya]